MKVPRASDKLEEARFFLQHLRSEDQKVVQNRPAAFRYFLSAFLNAARSVTWFLQKEAKATYDAFFPTWREALSPEDSKLLDFMNAQRVAEVHREGARTTLKEKAVPAQFPPGVQVFGPEFLLDEKHIQTMRELGLPPGTMAWMYVPESYFEFEGDSVKALQLCERYFAILERLLREFPEAEPEPNR